jgi:SPP1 family predicted phage head-tail adaptor
MKSSAMDRRVTILVYSRTQDAAGGAIETWTDGDTVWAERRDQSGREFMAAGQVNAAATALFFIRWRCDITAKTRLRCDGLEYDVASIKEIGRRDGLDIVATARRA